MSQTPQRPPYDAELAKLLENSPQLFHLNEDTLHNVLRKVVVTPETPLTDNAISHEEKTFQGPEGEITLSILTSKASAGWLRPAIYHIHGGARYRLAPENPYPAAIEDCYAGLKYVSEHATELGIDAEKIIIEGSSAEGGLAAGTALMARDRKGPKLLAQFLKCPLLDDRMETMSSRQFLNDCPYPGTANITAWNWYLGGKRGTKEVEIYAAPSRAEDLSGLPKTYIDVSSAEVMRDEVVAYTTKLWEYGVDAELHVTGGGFHGYTFTFPEAQVSKDSKVMRLAWLERKLAAASRT